MLRNPHLICTPYGKQDPVPCAEEKLEGGGYNFPLWNVPGQSPIGNGVQRWEVKKVKGYEVSYEVSKEDIC